MGRPSSRARSRAVRDWRRRSQEDVQRKEGMQRHHMPQEKEVLLCQEDQGEGPQEVHFLQTCVLPVWARLLRQRVQTRAHLRKRQLLNRSSSSNTLLGCSNPHGWCGLKSTRVVRTQTHMGGGTQIHISWTHLSPSYTLRS